MTRTVADRARRKRARDKRKLLEFHTRKWERKLKPLRDAIEASQQITEKDLNLIVQ